MPFNETTKKIALERSAFRCCICHDLASDIHHIIPQVEKGPDTIENAAPLCSTCHDLFGDNPKKRKKIKLMRDYWWKIVEARNEFIVKTGDNDQSYVEIDPNSRNLLKNKGIAIYHVINKNDTFEDAARVLFHMIYSTQKDFPNSERYLVIDILEHRNEKGGFDHDMFELQSYFNLNVVLPYVQRIYSPLISVQNKFPQRNDVPEELTISNHSEAKMLTKDKLKFKK